MIRGYYSEPRIEHPTGTFGFLWGFYYLLTEMDKSDSIKASNFIPRVFGHITRTLIKKARSK
jgi:hypothetical protein